MEYESYPAEELKRLLAVEAAALAWRDARDEAVRFRLNTIRSGEAVDILKIMIPVGKALDTLAELLPPKKGT